MGQSIPLACQDWANTKAAYRFLSNDRVSEADILAGQDAFAQYLLPTNSKQYMQHTLMDG